MATQQTRTENYFYLDRIQLKHDVNFEFKLKLFIDNVETALETQDNRTWTPVQRLHVFTMSYLRVDLQLRRGRLFWAAHLQPSRTIPLRRLLSDYWDSTGYEFVLPECGWFGKDSWHLDFRFFAYATRDSLRLSLQEFHRLMSEDPPLICRSTRRSVENSIESGVVFAELSPIAKSVFSMASATFELLKEQCKHGETPSGFLDRLQYILSFANKKANGTVCEEIELLEEIIPCALKVMRAVANISWTYVKLDGRFDEGTIKDANKALTKIIKYFNRVMEVEALHLPNETGPSMSIGAPIGRLPVELWQDLLLLAIESDGYCPISTACTSSTFLHFLDQEMDPDNSYIEYVRRRATLRQVCRSWNQFLESTATWWVHVRGPFHPDRTFGLPPIADQVAIVKRLSITITTYECIQPALNWASDLFQMVQAPILSYNVNIESPYYFAYHPPNFLARVTAKKALRRLHIASNGCCPISFSQLNAKFRGLVSLSLSASVMRSAKELTLPLLELLHITECPESPPLPTQWVLPRLRHLYIALIRSTTDFNTVLNFSRRYASQLESLFLLEYPSQSDIPHDFWESFTSLQMFGARYHVSNHCTWNGWDITPPRSHPFRYLALIDCEDPEEIVNSLRSTWTYHEDVALVLWQGSPGARYLVENIKQEERTRMTQTNGILPMRRADREAIS